MGYGGNQYTAFNEFRKKYGPEAMFPYRRRPLTKKQRATLPPEYVEQYDKLQLVKELPRKKRRANSVPRSDKGKPRKEKKGSKKVLAAKEFIVGGRIGKLDFMRQQRDLKKQLEEKSHLEELERMRLRNLTPRRVAINEEVRKDKLAERAEKASKRYHSPAAIKERRERRELVIPANRICVMCEKHKPHSKFWVAIRFSNCVRSVCKNCYELMRINHFRRDKMALKTFFRGVEFDQLEVAARGYSK
jgi:hypothetical protein